MEVLRTVAAAFSMFSAIPVPQVRWSDRTLRWMLCAFPLVGAAVGAVCAGAACLCGLAGLPALLRGALLCVLPVLLTGGIHLDGFADTCDALASHAEPERRLEILKDPHVGSFAVIRLCAYFVLELALWTVLPAYRAVPVLLGMVLSRTLSGLAVAEFPLAKNTGLAHSFAGAADRKKLRTVLAAAAVLLSAALCCFGPEGIAMAAAEQLVFVYYYHMSRRQFGGVTGDLAGWFLVRAEQWMLAALAAVQFAEGLR